MKFKILAFLLGFLHLVPAEEVSTTQAQSPYIELILCITNEQPWECAKEQSSKLLTSWNRDLVREWSGLKVEADKELNRTLQKRGFSLTEKLKEKPSTILNKIQIGANYIQDFVITTANKLLGRQEEYELPESDEDVDDSQNTKYGGQAGGGFGDNNNDRDESLNDLTPSHKKTKKKPLNALSSIFQHHYDTLTLSDIAQGFGGGVHGSILGNKHGLKLPLKYGRSLGVTRGKRKKKKILMKVMLLATLIKGKIELLLKILSAHLQIKFFAIALIGLLVNIARFWIDLRRGAQPNKVIYYEHAHHQHHYDGEHPDEWGGEQPQSGYWKRSLPPGEAAPAENYSGDYQQYAGTDDPYSKGFQQDSQSMAYRRQIPQS